MGLIDRLQRITAARVEAFLGGVDHPERVLPQLLRELDQRIQIAAGAEGKARAALQAAQRQLDELAGRIQRLARGAELALRHGDEATARDALAAQIQAEQTRPAREQAVQQAESAVQEARAARDQLTFQLGDLRARESEILARARAARIARAALPPHASQGANLLDAVARMEARVDEDEAAVQVRRTLTDGGHPHLEDRLLKLEREAAITARIESLRRRKPGKKA